MLSNPVRSRNGPATALTLRHPQVQKEEIHKSNYNMCTITEGELPTSPGKSYHTTTNKRPAKVTNLFSNEVFRVALSDPSTAHQLKRFSQARFCEENLEFLDKVDQYHESLSLITKTMFDIHRDFISITAPSQLNLSHNLLAQVKESLKLALENTIPAMESIFLNAQSDVETLIATDIYPRFVRHQMSVSAAKALAGNKNKYAGLGDCFVLTDPSKTDNPIVYASDGFVHVTGYSRNEIIPRNCRFLQARNTDRNAVKRLRATIDNNEEHVELLLNERKNGEPFWNLLYTAPLYDSTGTVAFFIGGQIDISTTVHSTSDVLRVLSASDDESDGGTADVISRPKAARTGSFFKTILGSSDSRAVHQPGMENTLLGQLNGLTIKDQTNSFYSAYSKYIVINVASMTISFYSSGITRLFQPVQEAKHEAEVTGMDVFKFLSQHAMHGLSKDYKHKIKNAIKLGQPISIDLTLSTKRAMGLEEFVTHWTPLKSEQGETAYVVLTFGSHQF